MEARQQRSWHLPLLGLASVLLSVLHYWARIAVGALLAVRRSDNARASGQPPQLFDYFLEGTLEVLSFPLTLVDEMFGMTSFVGWPWMINSLLWGVAICYSVRWGYRQYRYGQ